MPNDKDQLKERLPLIVNQSIMVLGLRLLVLLLVMMFAVVLVWTAFQGPNLPGSWTGAAITFSFLTLGLTLVGGIYLIVWHQNQYYIISEGSVIRQRGVFWKRREELNVHDIQNISAKQSFISRMLGYGTVRLDARSFDEGLNEMVFKHIPRPYYYLDLMKRVFNKENSENPA